MRIGLVLGLADGIFPRALNLVKCGMGGRQGNGRQYMSWIHELDVIRITEWIAGHPQLEGVFNCTAPNPVKNNDFMAMLRKARKFPFGLPTPAWLLNIGATIIGTEPELILKSRWVLPKRLIDSGFEFQYNEAEKAIQSLI